MPKVGNQSYGYDPIGIAKAKREAKKTGQAMTMEEGMGQAPPQEGTMPNQGQTLTQGNKPITQFAGGVQPIDPANLDPNRNKVNHFMNQNAVGDMAGEANVNPNNQDVAKLQNGLNFLNKNRPGYTPLKVDGNMGPKTRSTADQYLGKV